MLSLNASGLMQAPASLLSPWGHIITGLEGAAMAAVLWTEPGWVASLYTGGQLATGPLPSYALALWYLGLPCLGAASCAYG